MAFLRIVRVADGVVRLDPTGRASGRGAYVCRDGACLARAGGRSALGHALRAEVPADLRATLATMASELTAQPAEVE